MTITMRVRTLTLDQNQRRSMATLYRYDRVKSSKERGWMDRVTIPAGDLTLGDLVSVTIEQIDDET